MNIPKSHYCVITAISKNTSTVIKNLTAIINNCNCNIMSSRAAQMGDEITITMLISGNWGGIAKIESLVPNIESELDIVIHTKRTKLNSDIDTSTQSLAYSIQITGVDKNGILNSIVNFFAAQSVSLEDVTINTFSNKTNSTMANINLLVRIPEATHLGTIRERFMNLCDKLNLDAAMEPTRD